MKTKVGTWPWLVVHEVRLRWRELLANRRIKNIVWWVGSIMLILHLVAFFVLTPLRGNFSLEGELSPVVWLVLSLVLLFTFSLLLSVAITESVTALFERGDLDLLVSSPTPTKAIFIAKSLGVASNVFLSFIFFVLPIGTFALMAGVPQLLGGVPTLAALSLIATALAMLITLGLVRLIGTRRTRTVAQVLGSLLGALMFLLFQIPNMLGSEFGRVWQKNIADWLMGLVASSQGGNLSSSNILLWPAQAVLFRPLPLLSLWAVGIALLGAVSMLMYRTFLLGTQTASSGNSVKPRTSSKPTRFASGMGKNMLLKEWRLIQRDPYLISNTLLQMLYMLPIFFVTFRGNSSRNGINWFQLPVTTTWGLTAILLGSALSSNLIRITLSAEDAPDLLKMSPVSSLQLRIYKILAGLIPVWVIFSLPFVVLAARGEQGWFFALFCFVGSTLSSSVLQSWVAIPQPRADLFKRNNASKGWDFWIGLISFLVVVAWLAMSTLFGLHNSWGLAMAPLILLGMGLGYWRSQYVEYKLGY